jgi:hypothetical protein
MLEESVETHLRRRVHSAGGLCIKLNPKGYKGIPDRLVLLPGGVGAFVELKRPGPRGRVAALQHLWRAQLMKLGFTSVILTNIEEVDAFVNASVDPHR